MSVAQTTVAVALKVTSSPRNVRFRPSLPSLNRHSHRVCDYPGRREEGRGPRLVVEVLRGQVDTLTGGPGHVEVRGPREGREDLLGGRRL